MFLSWKRTASNWLWWRRLLRVRVWRWEGRAGTDLLEVRRHLHSGQPRLERVEGAGQSVPATELVGRQNRQNQGRFLTRALILTE